MRSASFGSVNPPDNRSGKGRLMVDVAVAIDHVSSLAIGFPGVLVECNVDAVTSVIHLLLPWCRSAAPHEIVEGNSLCSS